MKHMPSNTGGLVIKSMNDVFKNLVNLTTARSDRLTDFNVGSALRTMYEAASIQFEEFYWAMAQNTQYAIENSVYEAFGFSQRVSLASTGTVTVTFNTALASEIAFPQGTVFCTSGDYGYIYFESTDDVFAEIGTIQIDIPVQCKELGTIGNIPEGAITTIVTSNPSISSVTNTEAFTNGTNAETKAERKTRFQQYIRSLGRGTADALVYGTLEVEGVTGAAVDDSYMGYVIVYAHDSDGNLSDELRKAIKDNLEYYRAAGIEVEVLPIVKHQIDVPVTVIVSDNVNTDTYAASITTLITNKLNAYVVGNSFYVSDIIASIKDAYMDTVINVIVPASLKDVMLANNEVVRAGTVTVTCQSYSDWRRA